MEVLRYEKSMRLINCLDDVVDFDEALLKAAEEALPIPIGAGIAGHVALTKSGLRILDAYRVSDYFCGPCANVGI